MIINILAGGPGDHVPSLLEYNDNVENIWVGVDRGVFSLLSMGIKPSIAFGDFDSVTESEFLKISTEVDEIKKFNAEKDETDMELAINWALRQHPEKIRVFGATGGRLDHFFANVQLILKPILHHNLCQIEIIDHKNLIFVKNAGSHKIETMPDKKYVSFVPMTSAVENLTLIGFKYPLNNQRLPQGSTLCISNELIQDNGTFSFSEGILLVIRSSD